ncbi:hypothetical protein ACIO13_27655 [Streptomyces sp. NPDC087425]|uniref:hypothetical protein n=1 Tax=Streptomyces sp. NPDC087425 TaxID=3365787 RepID=UPI00382B3A33
MTTATHLSSQLAAAVPDARAPLAHRGLGVPGPPLGPSLVAAPVGSRGGHPLGRGTEPTEARA